jgi:hypothetical protein
VFEASVHGIIVIENSRHARAHLGMYATTRPNCILLAISGAEFAANRGYRANRYEQEAREFAATARERFDRLVELAQ